jgi:nucleotide-binding universal stress UspA family protein
MTPEQTGTSRVVAGIDGSAASLNALTWAARQAELTGARLEILAAWDWPTTFGWAVPVPNDFNPEAEVQSVLDEAVASVRASHPALPVDARVARGHPAPALVEASKGADVLVVGSRGHGEFLGMLIGSVSEYCTTNAHCPVLIHRPTT